MLELVACGLKHIVLSPGSRSQALALAAGDLERQGLITLHVHIDERTAGFFALGIAKASGVPAAVIVTSGSAPANLHPAVIEAHESVVPLIVVSADRPARLHGIRANQTTDQAGLFATAVRKELHLGANDENISWRECAAVVFDSALGVQTANPGPVYLNIAFDEPLSEAVLQQKFSVRDKSLMHKRGHYSLLGRKKEILDVYKPTLVLAGSDAGDEAVLFAQKGDFPLCAEVCSNARWGENIIVSYEHLLRNRDFVQEVQRVVVFGYPTLSRDVERLMSSPHIETIVVAPFGEQVYNPLRAAMIVGALEVRISEEHKPAQRAWLDKWRSRDSAVRESEKIRDEQDSFTPVTRNMLVEQVWEATHEDDCVMFAASRLVRVAESCLLPKKVTVYANRGVAGIDGTIATALGIEQARREFQGTTRLIMGDLAFLHDVGSLLAVEGNVDRRLQIIVGNDQGGTIFANLGIIGANDSDMFERVFLAPPRVNIQHLAEAYGCRYENVSSVEQFRRVLFRRDSEVSIIEIELKR